MALKSEQSTEIGEVRALSNQTRRATVPALEEELYAPIPVLDHGFIRVIDYMGDDSAIVQAARVSYGAGTKKMSDDRGLIRYLMRHRHSTPFEMCEIKFHVKLPIFVARQWVRHRTANINEYSARYSILDREFYVPDYRVLEIAQAEERLRRKEKKGQTALFDLIVQEPVEELAAQSTKNKQGREEATSEHEATDALKSITRVSGGAYKEYLRLLNEEPHNPNKAGLARELARIVLPTNFYTQWYWKIDLHNLLHFLSLRADSHAQYEIREYANRICEVVKKWVPLTWEAYEEFRQRAAHISATALSVVKRMIAGENVTQADSGLSKREWVELMKELGKD